MADHVLAYSFASPRRQLFSFPPDMIASMLKNPSSHKGLLKLYQTCKYFYAKRPILIADDVLMFDTRVILNKLGTEKIFHLKVPIWVTNTVLVMCFQSNVLPKLFRCSANRVCLSGSKLPFDDFIFLSSKNMVNFSCSGSAHIYHSDMSKALIEEILQFLPNIQHFEYYIDEKFTLESLTKLNKIKFSNKLKSLYLDIKDIHPTFDFNLFCEFIMKNSNADTDIVFVPFGQSIEKLKLALQKLDPKWKKEAHHRLKKLFQRVNPNW